MCERYDKTEFLRQQRITPLERAAIVRLAADDGLRLCEAVRLLLRRGAQVMNVWPIKTGGDQEKRNERAA